MSSPPQNAITGPHAIHDLAAILHRNHRGEPVGVYAVCSANRFVLEAAMLQAHRDHTLLLIESTSNQVNQFGGYTGQNPAQFVAFVKQIASAMNFPPERIVFGGDHLGPHPWRKEDAPSAMAKACELVRACVHAGYTKMHLDASMKLAGDLGNAALPDEIISERAAILCEAAELAQKDLPAGSPSPLYVIGTEVPIPGGELTETRAPEITRTQALSRTIDLAKQAFEKRSLQQAWPRVVAVVVQPGVEFSDAVVFPYIAEKTQPLVRFAEQNWHGVYEAHSTDYQTPAALRAMVRDHFAILKVGPWLTFAFRDAVFALAAIEEEWLGSRRSVKLSGIREALEDAMIANPEHWKGYYQGDEPALRVARKYSLSDRIRYYWPVPAVASALGRLLSNLEKNPPPVSLLGQYLPNQAAAIRNRTLANHPADLIRHKILAVTGIYAQACGMNRAPAPV
ncbi:MAG TPA: class II D-tagatose-bisphosphate aldolase, non-catalytic subunit [Terriglobales bacterium]